MRSSRFRVLDQEDHDSAPHRSCRRVRLIPVGGALPELKQLPDIARGMSGGEVVELIERCKLRSRLLTCFAVAVGGRPADN